MNILVFLSCLIYLSRSEPPVWLSGANLPANYNPPANPPASPPPFDLSYNDISTGPSQCPPIEDILDVLYDEFLPNNVFTFPDFSRAHEVEAYFDPYFDAGITYNGNGVQQWTDLTTMSQQFVFQAWIFNRKEAYNLKNIRYGQNYVAVDFEIGWSNICGGTIDNVQSFGVFYCNAAGKITSWNILRDQTDNLGFLINTAQCIGNPP